MQAEYADVRFDGPPRSYSSTPYDKRYVAIHNTANDATDAAEANYAQVRIDSVSSHYYVDADSITQSLRTEYGANHAGSTTGNRHAIAYEITGTNAKTRTWWLANVAWDVLARQIARDCAKHGIVPRLLTVAQMRDGKTTGLVTHDLMRQAWGGTTHTDPGLGFPMDHLLALVAAEMEDGMPTPEEYAAAVWKYNAASSANPVSAIARLNQAAASAATAAARTPADLEAQLDAILAAALDDGDTTVVLPPDGIAALEEIKAAFAAVPTAEENADAVLDAEHARLES